MAEIYEILVKFS